jgi:hypothetical protein
MPSRDHFRPPVWRRASWEGFHGMWPATIVQQLSRELPPEFTAEPRAGLGSYFEIEVCAYEEEQAGPSARYVAKRVWRGSDGNLVALGADVGIRNRSQRAIRL